MSWVAQHEAALFEDGEKPMKLKVEETKGIDEGRHVATITKITNKDVVASSGEKFEYLDIFLSLEGTDITMKYGCPAKLTPMGKLGRLLACFGELTVGEVVDIDKALLNKKISFITQNKATKDGIREDRR